MSSGVQKAQDFGRVELAFMPDLVHRKYGQAAGGLRSAHFEFAHQRFVCPGDLCICARAHCVLSNWYEAPDLLSRPAK